MTKINTHTAGLSGFPDCRVALGALPSEKEALVAALRNSSILRRLYLMDLSGMEYAPDDSRVVLIRPMKGVSLRHALEKAFADDFLYFAEGSVGTWISNETRSRFPEACDEAERALLNHTRRVLSSVALRSTRGWHMLANAILNLPRAIREHSVSDLRCTAQGKPVVIVGAGPSLDGSVADLAAQRSRFVLIACDGAWSTLEHAHIVPDLVVSTDDSEKTWRYFAKRTGPHTRVPVVCRLETNWAVVRHHTGPLFFCCGRYPHETAIQIALPRPISFLDTGLCVGHAALEVAGLMGGRPIILTGFDLAYDASGTRFHPQHASMPYFHKHPPPPSNLATVPGNRGETLKTDISMLLYLREFEKRAACMDIPILNATVGGARIEGIPHVTLNEALSDATAAISEPLAHIRGEQNKPSRLNDFIQQWTTRADALIRALDDSDTLRIDDAPALQTVLRPHKAILDFLTAADNPAEVAALHFGCTSSQTEAARTEHTACLSTLIHNRISSIRTLAQAIQALLRVQNAAPASPAKMLTASQIPGADTSLFERCAALAAASGMATCHYEGNPHDLPALWMFITTNHASCVLNVDGHILPAGWGIPGTACLDLRTGPPIADDLPEQWLPGYAVVCDALDVAQKWRAFLPTDRPVWILQPDGRLASMDDPKGSRSTAAVIRSMVDECKAGESSPHGIAPASKGRGEQPCISRY